MCHHMTFDIKLLNVNVCFAVVYADVKEIIKAGAEKQRGQVQIAIPEGELTFPNKLG